MINILRFHLQVGAQGEATVWEKILACGSFPGSWERQNLPSRSIMNEMMMMMMMIWLNLSFLKLELVRGG